MAQTPKHCYIQHHATLMGFYLKLYIQETLGRNFFPPLYVPTEYF